MDLPGLHSQTVDNTQRIIDAIGPSHIHGSTPCGSWDVQELVRHIVYGNLWVPPLVAGETIEQIGTRFEGDVLGDDFGEAFRASGRGAVEAFNAVGAMDAPCAVSYGPVPGSVYCGHRIIDVLVHGWDLAVATDGDAELPPPLIDGCIQILLPQVEMLGGSGMFGHSTDPGAGTDPQSRLLALVGRAT